MNKPSRACMPRQRSFDSAVLRFAPYTRMRLPLGTQLTVARSARSMPALVGFGCTSMTSCTRNGLEVGRVHQAHVATARAIDVPRSLDEVAALIVGLTEFGVLESRERGKKRHD